VSDCDSDGFGGNGYGTDRIRQWKLWEIEAELDGPMVVVGLFFVPLFLFFLFSFLSLLSFVFFLEDCCG
jgi:hypothetical protein